MTKKELKIACIVAKFNVDITGKLLEGAKKAAKEEGISEEQIDIFWVPGAFELPQVASKLSKINRYNAIISLGAVLEGETKHFDYVCMGVTTGLTQVSLEASCPILFGVLTANRLQAEVRSRGDRNKGYHTFKAALDMIETNLMLESMSENLLH